VHRDVDIRQDPQSATRTTPRQSCQKSTVHLVPSNMTHQASKEAHAKELLDAKWNITESHLLDSCKAHCKNKPLTSDVLSRVMWYCAPERSHFLPMKQFRSKSAELLETSASFTRSFVRHGPPRRQSNICKPQEHEHSRRDNLAEP